MQLKNAVVVVSGGASGLGRGTAEYLVRNKAAKVALLDIDREAGNEAANYLPVDRASFFYADVADEVSVADAIERVLDKFGAIHACINCAGILTPMKIVDRERRAANCQTFARNVSVNLVGTFNVMAHCVAAMMNNEPGESEERGVVVNVASGAAFDGQVGQSAYAASKAGVVGLSLPAARELGSSGVRVNAIAPGMFLTSMRESLDPKVVEALLTMVEFPKRPGSVDEFASLAAYICENSYLNGECIRLDGAARLRAR